MDGKEEDGGEEMSDKERVIGDKKEWREEVQKGEKVTKELR